MTEVPLENGQVDSVNRIVIYGNNTCHCVNDIDDFLQFCRMIFKNIQLFNKTCLMS